MKCRYCKTKFTPKKFLLKFCLQTDDCRLAAAEYGLEQARKQWNKRKKEIRKTLPAKKNYLQMEINKLSRTIDLYYYGNCIDCGKELRDDRQAHGAHFHDVGSHNTLRYNLHNIHAATSHCNKYDSNHKVGYREGLIRRYGGEYLDFVDGLKSIRFRAAFDKDEKLKVVRKLIREFDGSLYSDGCQARDAMNSQIGIY